MKQFILHHSGLLLVGWILLIFVLCATPGQYIPSADWMDLLSLDKLVHAGIFFVLNALFVLRASQRGESQTLLFVYTALSIVYGISLECMQARWFVHRSYDVLDMVANTLGCLLALSLAAKLQRIFKAWTVG